jgi:peptidyl-prolyl cis-trans isomerase B (cyclophilin B)
MIEKKNPVVSLEINGKTVKIELYPSLAPNTVNNFISLVNKGFYNGLTFHRVIKNFMIQGGDPAGTGMGGPNYVIRGEFKNNGFTGNTLKHERGVISMARAYNPNSAGSQFFIMHKDAFYLDGQYAAFGKVIEGMDVVDEIAETKTGSGDKPVVKQIITKITVDTFGEKYPEPVTIKKF